MPPSVPQVPAKRYDQIRPSASPLSPPERPLSPISRQSLRPKRDADPAAKRSASNAGQKRVRPFTRFYKYPGPRGGRGLPGGRASGTRKRTPCGGAWCGQNREAPAICRFRLPDGSSLAGTNDRSISVRRRGGDRALVWQLIHRRTASGSQALPVLTSTSPATTRAAASQRSAPNFSCRKIAPIAVAKRTELSRTAATAPIGAIVIAHSATA